MALSAEKENEAGPKETPPIENVRSYLQSWNSMTENGIITLTFVDDSIEECVFLGWVTPAGILRPCPMSKAKIADISRQAGTH